MSASSFFWRSSWFTHRGLNSAMEAAANSGIVNRGFALTRRVRGAKNRRICPLVVSLLPRCGVHHASEAAGLPGRAGCRPLRA